jgi:hypothetical protein
MDVGIWTDRARSVAQTIMTGTTYFKSRQSERSQIYAKIEAEKPGMDLKLDRLQDRSAWEISFDLENRDPYSIVLNRLELEGPPGFAFVTATKTPKGETAWNRTRRKRTEAFGDLQIESGDLIERRFFVDEPLRGFFGPVLLTFTVVFTLCGGKDNEQFASVEKIVRC